jgi:hypothetical protein
MSMDYGYPMNNYTHYKNVKFVNNLYNPKPPNALSKQDEIPVTNYQDTPVYKILKPVLLLLKCFFIFSIDKREIKHYKTEIFKRVFLAFIATAGVSVIVNNLRAVDMSNGLRPDPTMLISTSVWCSQVIGTILAANYALYDGRNSKTT